MNGRSGKVNEGTLFEGCWFVRPKDVERATGISASSVRQAIYAGRLEARKFRERGWLIDVQEARRWIEEESVSNKAA